MKIYFILFITLFSFMTNALPVMNENMATGGIMTVYPDHQDPHKYYVAPTVVLISKNDHGTPLFNYYEVRTSFFTIDGYLSMTLTPAYSQAEIENIKNEILKKDSQAQFIGIPFMGSSINTTNDLSVLFKKNACAHQAGLIGQEQACEFVLSNKGRNIFINAVKNGLLFTTMDFNYSVNAVIKNADNSYTNQLANYTVAARIDGAQLAEYPELIRIITSQ